MKLVFSDDFNGEAVDETKWTFDGSKEVVTVKGGKLTISLKQRPEGWQGSGLSTREKFSQVQGYFEASVRFNATKGHHGAFVVKNLDKTPAPAGALYFECFGDDRLTPWAKMADSRGVRELRPTKTGLNLSPGQATKKFNTYGFWWNERGVMWYFNDHVIHKIDKVDIKEPMVVYLGHWVSDFESKDLVPAKLPDDFEVDWVKVWK
jgi:beta-glucanase (GH16 family)